MPPPPLTLNPHAPIREEMSPVMPSHPLSPCGRGRGDGLSGHNKGAGAALPSCPTPSNPPSVILDVVNPPSVILDVVNPPAVIPDVVNPPSAIPDVVNPPSVIPDVVNRESMVFPCRPTNKRTKKQDTGFPLTTGGHDKGGAAGMTEGERKGETRRGRCKGESPGFILGRMDLGAGRLRKRAQAGGEFLPFKAQTGASIRMTGDVRTTRMCRKARGSAGWSQEGCHSCRSPCVIPALTPLRHARRAPLSFPQVVSGNPVSFSSVPSFV